MKRNVLVVTQWAYEEGLIQSYTLPYLRIIHKVNPHITIYLITQEKSNLQSDKEKYSKITEALKSYNIVLLPEKYYRAGLIKYLSATFYLLKHLCYIIFKRIGYIHTFCTPAGGYGYILSKITGRKLVVDSYEPHAEYMVECGVWKESEFAFKVLNSLEKKQALRAKHLIATTPTMVPHTNQRFQINIRDWEVKPACVDLEKFSYDGKTAGEMRSQLGLHNKIVCVYAGKFGDFYLKEEVFEFYKVAFEYWKEKFHVLLLSDISRDELDEYCNRFQLPPQGFTLIKAPHSLVPKYMSAADFGLSPYRPTPSKRFCTPIKNGEYWALGLPVVITKDISVDSDMISEKGIGYVLNDLTPNEYLNAVKKIDELLKKERDQLRKQIRQVAVDNRSFSIAESIYQKIYN